MKKTIILVLVSFMMIMNIKPVNADEGDFDITSQYAIAIDKEQGTILYEKNSNEKMYPASITKIVTAIVAINKIKDLQETVVITKQDLDTIYETDASAAWFIEGEEVTYKDLLYGVLLPSGADACRALGFNLFGDQETMVEEMNKYVESIGLKNTHFENTTGIHSDNHYSTAHDLGIILGEVLKNETFYEIFCEYMYTTSNGVHSWANTGKYFSIKAGVDVSKIIGCKSGYTEEAEHCLASLVKNGDRETIVVVGYCPGASGAVTTETNSILAHVQSKYSMIQVLKENDILTTSDVLYSSYGKTYTYKSSEDVSLYLPNDFVKENAKYIYDVNTIAPPIKEGDEIGSMSIKYEGKVLYKQTFVAKQDIEKDWFQYIKYVFFNNLLPYIGVGLLVAIYFVICFYDPKTKKIIIKK